MNHHSFFIKNATTEQRFHDNVSNDWTPFMQADYNAHGLRMPNALKAVERAIQLKENPTQPDACQAACLQKYLPQDFLGAVEKQSENAYTLTFNDGTIKTLLLGSEAQKPYLTHQKGARIVGWTGINAGLQVMTDKIEILKAYNTDSPRPFDDASKQLKPLVKGIEKSFNRLIITGTDLIAKLRSSGYTKSYFEIALRPADSTGSFQPINTNLISVALNLTGTDLQKHNQGTRVVLEIKPEAFSSLNQSSRYEAQITGATGLIPPDGSPKSFSVSNDNGGLQSRPLGSFILTNYNPPTYNGFQIVLPPGAHHIPMSANQIAAFGIQSPDPDNMQVIIDGRSMPIRQVAQDYLTFGLPADLAPGVKDVIIKLAGDTVTLQEALEVLALPPLELVQTIPTTGGYSNVSFTLGNDTFMVMNNVFNSRSSAIYKWNGSQFAPFQTIPLSQVSKGYDVEHFQIDGQDYLAFADWGDSTSQVYRWDGSQFAHLQILYADLSTDAEHFTMNGEHFLIFANYGGDTHNRIYKWNGSQFSLHQSLEAENPLDFEAFYIGEDHFFAMTNTGSTTAKSRILKWNPSTDRFDEFQVLNTTSPQKVTHFVKDGVPHLIFGHDDANPIYRWTGTDFELYRTLIGSSKWEWSFVRAGDKSYLLTGGVYSANGSYDTQSEVYLFE